MPPAKPPEPSILAVDGKVEVPRGSPVKVLGRDLPAKREDILVFLGTQGLGAPSWIAADHSWFTFVVPDATPLGRQQLRIKLLESPPDAPPMTTRDPDAGYVRVVSDLPALKVARVEPAVVTPETKHIWLFGEGMGGPAQDYRLLRDDREMKLCWNSKPCPGGNNARFISPYQLEVDPKFDDWTGQHQLTLRRGDSVAEAHAVQFIKQTPADVTRLSLLISLLLIGLLLAVTLSGKRKVRNTQRTGSDDRNAMVDAPVQRSLLEKLLLDPETDTYSLSKLQLLLWSLAGLLAYSYLSLSRALGQGHFDIADVPDNLPTMLGVSAGTTAISLGVSAAKGPKASGDLRPSISDLVSSGGVIAPDRFQLLLWTLIAVGTFLFSVFRIDPTCISELPNIPARLLELSTVSSGAYLAGKVVRTAGPVLDEVIARVGSLELTFLGRSLHSEASIEIESVSLSPFLDPLQHPHARPIAIEPDSGTGLSSTLKVKLAASPQAWRNKSELNVSVINPDGQRAAAVLTLDAALKAQLTSLPTSLTAAPPSTEPLAPSVPLATSSPLAPSPASSES